MDISIKNANSNNLKNVSLDIPLNKITGITGVSGSGKSTLVRDVLAKSGYINYTVDKNKSIKNSLIDYTCVDATCVDNVPPVLLIDVLNQINNKRSTVSTITGIHSTLRSMFFKCGKLFCENCNSEINRDAYELINNLEFDALIELEVTKEFEDNIEMLNNYIKIEKVHFYDKNMKLTKVKKSRKYATLYFDIENNKLRKISKYIKEKFEYDVKVYLKDYDIVVNPNKETFCEKCHKIVPNVTLKQFSFNIPREQGGGQCTKCHGLGEILNTDIELFIEDEKKTILDGAIKYVSAKGIKYTTVDAYMIEKFANKNGFKKTSKLIDLNEEQKHKLFFGCEEIITYKIKGKSNSFKFEGIINYLAESLSKGKGKKELQPLFSLKTCDLCEGSRLDSTSNQVKIDNYNIKMLLSMSIEELRENLVKIKDSTYKNLELYRFLDVIIGKLDIYCKLSCGYLKLNRASNSLSGGELQRLRLGKYISESISSMCIILDEPTTGLHTKNIKDIIEILYLLKAKGNTIILVEHNRSILNHCDYIIDLGPYGGKLGGNVLFSDKIENMGKYNTFTTDYLLEGNDYSERINKSRKKIDKSFKVKSNEKYNLKDFAVNIPKNFIISICGVSGSGKSTFINECLLPKLNELNLNINYLAQNRHINQNSIVCNLLEIYEDIAGIYHKINNKIEKSCFMINSIKGKCDKCSGKGFLYSIDGDNLGYCDKCEGKKFNEEVLQVKYKGLNINELLGSSIDDVLLIMEDQPKIFNALSICKKLGIGYLTLDRSCKSLSKGEYQRIKLVSLLNKKEKDNIIVLDEPTKALHNRDLLALVKILRELQNNENTIIVVEHNIDFIIQSDYVLEFGPEAGEKGGYLIFEGYPDEMITEDTPTSKSIKEGFDVKKGFIAYSNEILWNINDDIYRIEKNKINRINIEGRTMELIKNSIENEYIRIIDPSYSVYSTTKKYSDNIENTPLIRTVDFSNKSLNRNNLNILQLLNLEYEITKMFVNSHEEDKQHIAKYAYNIHKKIGKCKICKGTGKIKNIDLSLLLNGGKLNSDTAKFLKEGSQYTDIKKEMKKQYGIDIGKSMDEMNDIEKNIFLYGDDEKIIKNNGKKYVWKGLVNIVLQQGKYYPNKDIIESVKNSLSIEECPECKGKLLSKNYADKKSGNLTYSQMLNIKIQDVFNTSKNNKNSTSKFLNELSMLVEFGLGNYNLNTSISELSNIEFGLLMFVSFYNNNLYDSIINIENTNLLDKVLIKKLNEYLKDWTRTNTIIINEN